MRETSVTDGFNSKMLCYGVAVSQRSPSGGGFGALGQIGELEVSISLALFCFYLIVDL